MPIDPITAGAIIAGGATLATGAMSTIGGANMNKKNRKWQEKMVKQQREYEEQVYQDRYSPAAQVQAYRSAGLNPSSGTQTMNVGTSSSTPTPATTPLDFSYVGEAGQAIASSLHAREAMKLQREQFNQTVTEQNRRFLIDLSTVELNNEEKRAIINSRIEELESLKLDNETKRLNIKMLEDFVNSGGNTYSDSSNLAKAQTAYAEAQTEYQDLMSKIAEEQSEEQKNVLRAQADSLKASAIQAYANAILADAQSEVAKSTKLKIDSETQIGNDKAAQDAALHELKLVEQKLINIGIQKDNVSKETANIRNRILNGNVKSFGEFGQFLFTYLHSLIPFASSPLKFAN